jgi:hypothetical protein
MTRVRRVAAVVVTLAATVLATTAQNDAHGATSAAEAATVVPAKPTTTHLHLHVAGCDTCRITLQRAVTGVRHVWTSTPKRVGSDHRVSWTVPASRTRGMSFVLRAPWAGNTGAVPNLVTRYGGAQVDSQVTAEAARHGRHAEGCWAGTQLDDVTLDFRVRKIDGSTLTGEPTKIPLAYATHTMSSWKPMVKAYRGTIGNQDAFYCTKPPTTKLVMSVPGCGGCIFHLYDGARRPENTWQSRARTVIDDVVTFVVPRPHTHGLSVSVLAPWDNKPYSTGYATMVAFRYAGEQPGSTIDYATARSKSHAFGCWAGISAAQVTLPVVVRKVMVGGTVGRTHGSIAYVPTQQESWGPRQDTWKGVLGTQDVLACHK